MALSDIFSRFRQSDAEYDEDTAYEDEGYDTSSSAVTQAEAEAPRFSAPRNTDKVINMKPTSLQNASVKIVQPTKYEEIMKEPVRFLRENKSVILNLEKVTSVGSLTSWQAYAQLSTAGSSELQSAPIPLPPGPLISAATCLTTRSSDEPRYA